MLDKRFPVGTKVIGYFSGKMYEEEYELVLFDNGTVLEHRNVRRGRYHVFDIDGVKAILDPLNENSEDRIRFYSNVIEKYDEYLRTEKSKEKLVEE